MIKGIAARICAGQLVLGVSLGAAEAQGTPQKTRAAAPSSNVRVDGSEAMFTTMCALYAAGYEGEVNEDNWSTFRTRIRERVRQQHGPAVEALREFYKLHQLRDPGAMLSR